MNSLIILLFLFSTHFCFAQSDSVKPVSENEVYEFINKEFSTYDWKIKISRFPYRGLFEKEYFVDSNTTLIGIKAFIYELKQEDTLKYFLTDEDYQFIISQIEKPVFNEWKKEKFSKKVKFKNFLHFGYSAGIPLFSINREIVIYCYGFLQRCHIYHLDKVKNEYVFIAGWQNGT